MSTMHLDREYAFIVATFAKDAGLLPDGLTATQFAKALRAANARTFNEAYKHRGANAVSIGRFKRLVTDTESVRNSASSLAYNIDWDLMTCDESANAFSNVLIKLGETVGDDLLQRVLRGSASAGPTYSHGFDTTDFETNWPRFVKAAGQIVPIFDSGATGFRWVINGVVDMQTGNNPATGEYHIKGARQFQVGFASAIGLTGPKKEVMRLVKLIKKHAAYIKGESRGKRDFI